MSSKNVPTPDLQGTVDNKATTLAPTTELEHRVRASLSRGEAPADGDLESLLSLISELRAESAARWEAIGRLAPAAKENRGRAQDQRRALDAVIAALDGLESTVPAPPPAALLDWRDRVRALCRRG